MPCSCNKQGLVYRDAHHFPAFSPRKKQIFETPMNKTDELRTARIESLVTPAELAQRHPVTADAATSRPPAAELKNSTAKTAACW
jgi:3-deoxy-7-phosphoheptulonate synthase